MVGPFKPTAESCTLLWHWDRLLNQDSWSQLIIESRSCRHVLLKNQGKAQRCKHCETCVQYHYQFCSSVKNLSSAWWTLSCINGATVGEQGSRQDYSCTDLPPPLLAKQFAFTNKPMIQMPSAYHSKAHVYILCVFVHQNVVCLIVLNI